MNEISYQDLLATASRGQRGNTCPFARLHQTANESERSTVWLTRHVRDDIEIAREQIALGIGRGDRTKRAAVKFIKQVSPSRRLTHWKLRNMAGTNEMYMAAMLALLSESWKRQSYSCLVRRLRRVKAACVSTTSASGCATARTI